MVPDPSLECVRNRTEKLLGIVPELYEKHDDIALKPGRQLLRLPLPTKAKDRLSEAIRIFLESLLPHRWHQLG